MLHKLNTNKKPGCIFPCAEARGGYEDSEGNAESAAQTLLVIHELISAPQQDTDCLGFTSQKTVLQRMQVSPVHKHCRSEVSINFCFHHISRADLSGLV